MSSWTVKSLILTKYVFFLFFFRNSVIFELVLAELSFMLCRNGTISLCVKYRRTLCISSLLHGIYYPFLLLFQGLATASQSLTIDERIKKEKKTENWTCVYIPF